MLQTANGDGSRRAFHGQAASSILISADGRTVTLFDFDAKVIDMQHWRRCYLDGQLALEYAERDPAFKAMMLDGLDRSLTDPDDRALFGLPPKAEASSS